LPIGFIFEIFSILPQFFEPFSQGWNWRAFLLFYLVLNGYVNVYKTKVFGPNGKGSDLPAVIKPGYHYCHFCQLNAPPRSHHCPVCDKCIFRRDHHCSFIAECIGHFNQRFYIPAVFNFLVASAIILTWNWSYMWLSFDGISVLMLWQLIVPHLALIFRVITFSQFLCVLLYVSSLVVFLFLFYLASAQIFCLYRGQTRVEYLMDIHAYNVGFFGNIRQSLGQRWPLILFIPFILSPLQSDGLSFATKNMESINDSAKTI
uniref:Palmitoyltransferase n=1 Tax=Dracunculus medinensis TaxID=318479 RepID=A0A0N4UBW2_DRAME